MTKTKRKIVLFGLLACLTVGMFTAPSISRHYSTEAQAITIQEGALQDTYALNTLFVVPEVTISTPEGNVSCSKASLLFPDGSCQNGSTFTLAQCGEYTIIYDTGKYQVSETFNVLDQKWSVSSSASSATYVNEFDYDRYYGYSGGEKTSMRLDNGKGGIQVKLAAGDTFTYNVPVNIFETGDLFDVIRCYPEVSDADLPVNEQGKVQFVTAKLIDCYDPSTYVEFVMWVHPRGYSSYAGAGGNNQTPVGLELRTSDNVLDTAWRKYAVSFEGKHYLHRMMSFSSTTNVYGTPLGNPVAATDANPMKHGGMNFQYDPYSQKVYTTRTDPVWVGDECVDEVINNRKLVCDLDAPELFTDKDMEIFNGFTTGDCYLTLQTYQNVASEIYIDIESIFGREGEALRDGNYVDTTAPTMTFKNGQSYDKPVYVQKGQSVILPEVNVFDMNGNGTYTTTVYANYGTDYEVRIATANNTFVPTSLTPYTVVYKAKDMYGNVSEKLINFVVTENPCISYTENKLSELLVGQKNVLPDIGAKSINGDVTLKAYVTNSVGEKSEIDMSTMSFIPTASGIHTITYEIFDGAAIKEFSYTVDCEVTGNVVVFKDEFYTNKWFIKNATYSIADYYAYTIGASDFEPHLCNVYVSLDEGEFVKLSETERKAYTITASATVDIKFEYDGQYSAVTRVNVVDAKYSSSAKMSAEDYAKYFLTEHATFYADSSAFNFVADGAQNSETISFINPLPVSSFSLSLQIPAELTEDGKVYHGNYGELEIKLVDYYNPANSFVCLYKASPSGMTYTIGERNATYAGVAMEDLNDIISISDGIVNNSKRISGALPIEFSGDLCYLEITMRKISGKAGVAVRKICNQDFSRNIQPKKSSTSVNNEGGKWGQYSTYEINPISVVNVLYPILMDNVTINMTAPSKATVTATNGVALNNAKNGAYTVRFDEIGTYILTYSIQLPSGKAETVSYAIIVTDIEAPTVTFADGWNETTLVELNVGVEHTVQDFVVTDNYSTVDNMQITVMITTGDGYFVGIGNKTFTFLYEGYYKVIVLAKDAAGNTTTVYYNVLAK